MLELKNLLHRTSVANGTKRRRGPSLLRSLRGQSGIMVPKATL